MGSIDQCIHDFDKIASQMDERAEEFFLTLFISGLKTEKGRQVSMH
jgi:hypothetical protein